MTEFYTKRMIAKSDIVIESGFFREEKPDNLTNILELKPMTGEENGFVFYDKDNLEKKICHVYFVGKRGRFEISCGTEKEYRNKGFMTEAIEALCQWIFQSTNYEEIWALPSNPTSVRVLEKNDFIKDEKLSDEINMFWYFKKSIFIQKVENK
ncbi:N-acetyltransferase [Anaerotruncus sp. 80]|uniref:N-acetyltransferase n=1 Tax=Anaerotruncus colihominis TaxID=169435 RepID=A0A845QI50_9FIRM|nr:MULTISPECIES: GNAT family N-acetyltransferase [Anaerotruncus]NBH61822.1 N-acetyltransferase [Anaerotruncus colihominis]NCF02477.1 N-acetyltransferase [Anaerotruncus sp. 80]